MSTIAWPGADGSPGPVLAECLRAATAAPSVHNSQPWLFRLRGSTLEVRLDRSRQLPSLDPVGRELTVSVGAALFNLRLAARAQGYRPEVALLPDPADTELAAVVRVTAGTGTPAAVRALADTIALRHTNRRPFADRPVPAGVVEELGAAAAAEGAVLLVVDPPLRDGVLALTRTAENGMRGDPAYRRELAAWTTPGGVGRRDGVPREAFGPRDRTGAVPLRDFTLGNGAPSAHVAFEPDPTIAVLFTDHDSPEQWLRAGAALQRMLLVATLRGLAATPLSQLVEVPRLRRLLADPATGQVAQTVLRFGYPTTAARPTPRRPLDEVLLSTATA
jgi:nitroreductase